jgi:lipopolysaccharide transport system permease protein
MANLGIRIFGNRRALENYRDLLFVLVQKEMQIRYKNKVLGYLWSIASPLASALVFFVVFKIMMRVQVENYTLVLMTGLFPWQWFANSVNSAPRMFAGNASLIKKLRFPRNIIPLSAVLNHMIHFLLTIPVIVLLLLYYHQSISWQWIYGIPILTAIQLVMVYGLSLFLASVNLFLRDLERLTTIVMNFAFYLAPILYTEDLIPEQYKYLVYFHPAAPLMIDWRNLFLHGTLNPVYLLASLTYAIGFFALGYWVYKTLSWRFGEVL